MPNIQDHALAIGQETLAQRPFDDLDSLILTQLCYMPMEGLLQKPEDGCTVAEAWAFLRDNCDPESLDPFQKKRYALTEVCAGLPRYRGWRMGGYVNHIDDALETQFCAATYDLSDGSAYVAFRGTDLSVAGWKEDLNMSFMVVPAQKEAADYVRRAAAARQGPLLLGGHSKGGNLSVYAGAFAGAEAQERIRAIYSFDGPGMYEEIMTCPEYQRVKERIRSFIPQSSVVGMLLNYHPVYTVVQAHSAGILQHDAMTWQVEDGDFVKLDGLDMSGKITDETLHAWLATMDREARRTLVNTVYQVVDASQAELVTELAEDWRDTAMKALEAIREIDPEMKKNVGVMLRSLFSTGASQVVRAILPNAARNRERLRELVKGKAEGREEPDDRGQPREIK